MNNQRTKVSTAPACAVVPVVFLMLLTATAQAAAAGKATSPPACITTQTVPLVSVPLGKAAVLKLQTPAARIIKGNPVGQPDMQKKEGSGGPEGSGDPKVTKIIDSRDFKAAIERPAALSNNTIADVEMLLLNPNEIYLLGKSVGSTNIIVVGKSGVCTIMDIAVDIDIKALKSQLHEFLRGSAIEVTAAADSIMLSGKVADITQVERAMSIAAAYTGKGGDSSKVINMLTVADPQQVMLEVKVAEISKTLVDKLGAGFGTSRTNGNWTSTILSNFLNNSPGSISATNSAGTRLVSLDAEKKDGLVKILAEPTIMAISGQEGSFLAGGRILIPVAQSSQTGVTTITLEEKEFGVALKFTPTVLASGRINLKVRPEVSELSPEGIGISEFGTTSRSILPLINTRKAETTVQLNDGQSFAIGGLVKNNVTQNIKAFPILGEIPIIGALFRSSDYQTDKTELVFVITPHLVKPLPPDYPLPTDNFIEPSRSEFFLGGKMEGSPPPAAQNPPEATGSNPPAASGFELK